MNTEFEEFIEHFKKEMINTWNSDPNMRIEDLIDHIAHKIFSDTADFEDLYEGYRTLT